MPLVRMELRNEYGLGDPDLYRAASMRDDPKAVLDGVAVSGLVGLLRQFGDLAGFASEIFHDLHEQVMATSARGHRVMAQVQRIEAALPQIENAVQNKKSHINFAYLPGSDWHANIQVEHDHLLSSDLPQFIMDSYEECRDPPRLFLLDKFDIAGAGACLKRYSDPTYFKRSLTNSEMNKEKNIRKEKKDHRRKIKGARILNMQLRHEISMSCHNSSIQSTSPGTDEQSFNVETTSTCDMRQKSDLGSRTPSIDSRMRFSCDEPVVNTNSSAETGEPMFNEPFESKLKIDIDEECSSLTLDERNSAADENSLLEQSGLRSPFVTWDEKTEILKPENTELFGDKHAKNVQNSESTVDISAQLKENKSTKSGLSDPEDISVCVRSEPHHGDLLLNTGKVSASFPRANCYEEVTNETDNYVDAMNSLESETETDSEFQTIREVKPSSIKNSQTENLTGDLCQTGLSNSESSEGRMFSLSRDLHKDFSLKLPIPTSFEAADHSSAVLSPVKIVSVGTDLSGVKESYLLENSGKIDVNDEQSFASTISELQAHSPGYRFTNLPFEDEKRLDMSSETFESSEKPAVKIWSNGGLLGLAPSKPPDFVAPATTNQVSASGRSIDGCNYLGSIVSTELHNDESSEKDKAFVPPDESLLKNLSSNIEGLGSLKSIESVTSCAGPVVGKEEHNKELVYSQIDCDKFQKLQSTSICHRGQHPTGNKINPCEVESSTPSIEIQSSELSSEEDTCISSSLPGLASNLHKRPLFDYDQRQPFSTIPTSNTMVLQERSFPDNNRKLLDKIASPLHHESVKYPKENLDHESLVDPVFGSKYCGSPSSPPLEHMKISFHPINNNAASKLKLEFPDGHLHESIEGLMFPSFQLLQGSVAYEHHLSSDSDDDTFCRSSPAYSENIPIHHSDSDFELWEAEEQLGSGNHNMLDTPHPILPSTASASISSSLDFNKKNHHYVHSEIDNENSRANESGMDAFQSGHVLDLPYLESLELSFSKQDEKYFGNGDPQEYSLNTANEQSLLAPLPPLPPLQWRITKKSLPHSEVGQNCRFGFPNSSCNLQPQISVKHQPRQISCKPPQPPQPTHVQKPTLHQTMSMIVCHKINGNKGVDQASNAKELDEMGDFLHQIRSKSFNLRRTVRATSDFSSGPTANIKVAAILEKANAIRQAVVSSDENWSE